MKRDDMDPTMIAVLEKLRTQTSALLAEARLEEGDIRGWRDRGDEPSEASLMYLHRQLELLDDAASGIRAEVAKMRAHLQVIASRMPS